MSTITPEMLSRSVIAVPPLARGADLQLDRQENERLVRYLAAGGVSTLLYGGNAVLYHVAVSQYAALLEMLEGWARADNLIIQSVGPAYGTMMDQAPILHVAFPFPDRNGVAATRDRDLGRRGRRHPAVRRGECG